MEKRDGNPNKVIQTFRKIQDTMNAEAMKRALPDYGVKSIDDIPYMPGEGEYHLLDVYSAPDAKGQLPVIVEVHGGAYCTCHKEINRQHGQWFATQGFRVVNVNYTLIPEGTIAEEMQELAKVFEWIEKNANEYGFDTDNLFLTGDSSGGHLVLLFAAIQNREDLQELLDVEPVKSGIKGVAATCPVGSFVGRSVMAQAITKLLGKSFKKNNPLKKVSYKKFLDKSMLPTFIVTAYTDIGIHSVSAAIHRYMKRKHIPHEYKCYLGKEHKNLPHVWNVLTPDWKESVEANTDIVEFFRGQMEE